MLKLDQQNASPTPEINIVLNELERTMVASIALMKRLRREKRRSQRLNTDHAVDQQQSLTL